jgi:hypothetical protein
VVNPQRDKVYPGEVGLPKPGGGSYPGRNRKSIDSLMQHETAKKAKLTREEMIATRLYTGPPYMFLNRGLRSGGRDAKKKGIKNFPATCAAFNSAIKKLRLVTALPPGRRLYRGLTNMALPQAVLDQGAFVEFGFSSATPKGGGRGGQGLRRLEPVFSLRDRREPDRPRGLHRRLLPV